MQIRINLSDHVKVKLTSYGEAVLAQYKLDEYRRNGGTFDPMKKQPANERGLEALFHLHKMDNENYRSFPLFELFQIYGPVIDFFMLSTPIVRNEVFIDIPCDSAQMVFDRETQ